MAEEYVKVLTPECRLDFPRLFEPWPADKRIDPNKYTASLIFKKSDDESWETLRGFIDQTIEDRWGRKIPKGRMDPILDGDEKEEEAYQGCWFFRVKTKIKPRIYKIERVNGTPSYVRIVDPSEIYAGCYVKVQVHPFAYTGKEGSGVSLSLNSMLLVRDGEPLFGASDPNDIFGDPPADAGGEVGEMDEIRF